MYLIYNPDRLTDVFWNTKYFKGRKFCVHLLFFGAFSIVLWRTQREGGSKISIFLRTYLMNGPYYIILLRTNSYAMYCAREPEQDMNPRPWQIYQVTKMPGSSSQTWKFRKKLRSFILILPEMHALSKDPVNSVEILCGCECTISKRGRKVWILREMQGYTVKCRGWTNITLPPLIAVPPPTPFFQKFAIQFQIIPTPTPKLRFLDTKFRDTSKFLQILRNSCIF